ncbi:MAG: hypothetical protein R2709_06455 [Marmoricola sp.]
MFGASAVTGAHDGRFNILLLGGDSGSDRWGLRADSITVASIDAETGHTVLFGLPRNMLNFPFAKGSIMAKQNSLAATTAVRSVNSTPWPPTPLITSSCSRSTAIRAWKPRPKPLRASPV